MSDEILKGRDIIQDAPKLTNKATKDWKDLERMLDSLLRNNEHNHNSRVTVFLHEFVMKKESIIKVLEEKNYEVEEVKGNNEEVLLRITLKLK